VEEQSGRGSGSPWLLAMMAPAGFLVAMEVQQAVKRPAWYLAQYGDGIRLSRYRGNPFPW